MMINAEKTENSTKGKNKSLHAIIIINCIGIPILICIWLLEEDFYFNYLMQILMIVLVTTNIAVLTGVFIEKRYTDFRSEIFEKPIYNIKEKTEDWDKILKRINNLLDEKRLILFENFCEALDEALRETENEHYLKDIDDVELTKLRLIELINKIEKKL